MDVHVFRPPRSPPQANQIVWKAANDRGETLPFALGHDQNMKLMNTLPLSRAGRLGAVLLFATHSIAAALDLTFPTKNRALLQGDGEGFYMFVDRDIEG